jgi:hypothetical protein
MKGAPKEQEVGPQQKRESVYPTDVAIIMAVGT